ncbi:MAG TPA: FtsK/SpoIIIE domain-containing protein, partial [Gaiellaceae bacterium]|nr:FtsK/SpoIIIE domain-containing protein [Gaiellaceae bacterium]
AEQAASMLGLPGLERPWLPALDHVVALERLPQPDSGSSAVIGVVDEPAQQRQRPYEIDLDAAGSMLVFGGAGSGKTTLLRTLAIGLAARLPVRDLHVYGLDFGSHGLASLEALPHCGAIVPGEAEERVERLFRFLQRTIDRRKEQFGLAGVFGVDEFRRARPDEEMPRILVLLDGYAGFASAFERVNLGELLDALPRLVSDGRSVGVHFAITSDRRGSLPGALSGLVPLKLVLRMADEDEYGALGLDVRSVRGTVLPPGRGFVDGSLEMQTAIVSDDPRAESQAAAISALGRRLTDAADTAAPPIRPLPTSVSASDLPAPERPLEVPLGVGDSDLELRSVSLAEAHFLVIGPYRTGRTTALRTIAEALRSADPTLELHLLAPRRSALSELSIWTSSARGIEECDRAATDLAARVEARSLDGDNPPLVVVVDDGDELADTPGGRALERIVRRGRDLNARIVASGERQAVQRAFSGWLREIRKDESGLLLDPDLDVDGDTFGVRLPRRSNLVFPPGRGFLVARETLELVQVASS